MAAHRIEESNMLIHPSSSQSSLLSPSHELQGSHPMKKLSCFPCNICIRSKPAILILFWNIIIGAIYVSLLSGVTVIGFAAQNHYDKHHEKLNYAVIVFVSGYAFLALVLLLYPVSGYCADIHFGRYRAVSYSFIFLWVAMLFLSAAAAISVKVKFDKYEKLIIPTGLFIAIAIVLVIVGLACYQANVIQFGLDQLLEAPSGKLGLFIHWFMWAYTLGSYMSLTVVTILPCYVLNDALNFKVSSALSATPFIFLVILTLLLAFTWYNHGWFYTEPGQHNPYKTVIKVLHFARKNKYPLRRSAFTYCDDFSQPSRIDFAKEIFGGPFTTPQVEDVKTLFRIIVVLVALGPLFILEVPGSFALFPLFALHISSTYQFQKGKTCTSPTKWIMVESGGAGYIMSICCLPLYTWVVYSLLRKRIPRILNRLLFAVALSTCGVVCMLVTDLVGHIRQHHTANSTCMFTSYYVKTGGEVILNMHWTASILPSLLLNIGAKLTQATAFEFISAQSPHSMKGLLVGVFFAIKGFFQFIGAIAILPFAMPSIWGSINPVTNCGFGYYLFTLVVALIGVAVFSIVVRRYKYRQRDERPYDARFVEAYYERYIQSRARRGEPVGNIAYSPSDQYRPSDSESDAINSTKSDYGTAAVLRHATT